MGIIQDFLVTSNQRDVIPSGDRLRLEAFIKSFIFLFLNV
ncbi:hypothetical protein D082_51120 (plasmid) [Synechocystis sp. PCC 6714]|nr:hypothetical protein D082_51120 [Synechocystis sp. PCC 6714]